MNGGRHVSFEPPRPVPVRLKRFWDEVAWQGRQLEEGDTLVPDAESRCFSVRYRVGGLPAERSARVTASSIGRCTVPVMMTGAKTSTDRWRYQHARRTAGVV